MGRTGLKHEWECAAVLAGALVGCQMAACTPLDAPSPIDARDAQGEDSAPGRVDDQDDARAHPPDGTVDPQHADGGSGGGRTSDASLETDADRDELRQRDEDASVNDGSSAGGAMDASARDDRDASGNSNAHEADARASAELQGVQQLSAGGAHTCAVLTSGSLMCWGFNASGQLGDGTTTDRAEPVLVTGVSDVVEVAAGGAHTCARRTSGAVSCWGSNAAGQLGDGTTENRLSPVDIGGGLSARKLAAGNSGTCAIAADDKVACWGEGSDATPKNVYLPTGGFEQVAVGGAFACVSYGAVHCWGMNMSALPPSGNSVSAVRDLAAGENHACAAKNDGFVSCWGQNGAGQLGLRSLDAQVAILNVENVADAVEVTAGKAHACARLASGAVKCWGSNASGQLGSAMMGTLAALVPGLSSPVEISAGAEHTCAREQRGVVKCWGKNASGQLGNGSLVDISSPTIVTGRPQ